MCCDYTIGCERLKRRVQFCSVQVSVTVSIQVSQEEVSTTGTYPLIYSTRIRGLDLLARIQPR